MRAQNFFEVGGRRDQRQKFFCLPKNICLANSFFFRAQNFFRVRKFFGQRLFENFRIQIAAKICFRYPAEQIFSQGFDCLVVREFFLSDELFGFGKIFFECRARSQPFAQNFFKLDDFFQSFHKFILRGKLCGCPRWRPILLRRR